MTRPLGTPPAPAPPRIGIAGWSLARDVASFFPGDGTHLERYARVFDAVEINSSFYRPHRESTYARWRDSVPDAFRFSVKLPRTITHDQRLTEIDALLDRFLNEAGHLGDKLGCILIQLPPSLRFDLATVSHFLDALRARTPVAAVCEPRHASWFQPDVRVLLERHAVGFVRADPVPVPVQDGGDAAPVFDTAGADGPDAPVHYVRLHGSPVIYRSSYSDTFLDALAVDLDARRRRGGAVWCILDNTAQGAAIVNALGLRERMAAPA